MKVVLDSLKAAEQAVGADYMDTGEAPKSQTLTEGLGGEGSVWQSPKADAAYTVLESIISSIGSKFKDATTAVEDEWNLEPTYVDKSDARAEWNA
nr:hypothetical protein [uncultured Actinomyces sp.]